MKPQDSFFVAQRDDNNEYVSGIDGQGNPTFSGDVNDAEWSPKESTVEAFINRHNIQNVRTKSEGGNHPPKPPISA